MPSARSLADLRLAAIRRADLGEVVRVHERAFPDGALTIFGPAVLERYYAWLLEGPHDAAIVGAWSGGHLVGFCAAGWFRGAMSGFLRANRWFLAGVVLVRPSLLATPLVRERMRQAVKIMLRFSRLRSRPSQPGAPDSRRFGVLSIATDPDVRGSGAGRALMADAEERARSQSYPSMVLTVHPDNTRAVRFYEELGWNRMPDVDGRWLGRMEKLL